MLPLPINYMDTWHVLRHRLIDHLSAYYDEPAKAKMAAENVGLLWVTLATLQVSSVRLLWENVFAAAERSGVADRLVRSAITEAGTLGEKIHDIWQKFASIKPVTNVPTLDAHQLWRRRCFINRKDLREQLAKLKDGSRRILVVNGPPGVPPPMKLGKTYTRELVQHLASVEAGFRVAYFGHTRRDGTSLTPDRLAEAIVVDELGAPGGAPKWEKESDEAWAKRVCTWMVQSVFAVRGSWWVIFDGLRDNDLPSATHELVGKLAERVARLTGNINIERLILIDYPEDRLPPNVASDTTSETVQPITQDHLAAYFRELLTQRGEAFENAAIDSLVDNVWTPTIKLHPEHRLRTLADNVDRVLGKMFPQ